MKNYSKFTAIIVSSLLFAIMHPHIGQASEVFIVGIFFAWIYIKTKSLLSSIFAHFVGNGIACTFIY
ncbi:CPBP family intramembrane glutamic endopeptidase [Clostridium saccharobutylicum]|uniref:CPBP family intramembrane glutamic endopeptidase n=1 Tax=Clostridium saccharobutylicum TaxID=169679 RepID=UPI0015710550|nr:CPBP family intramembrane metalloprotease [Clostridium saccharobutylicum]